MIWISIMLSISSQFVYDHANGEKIASRVPHFDCCVATPNVPPKVLRATDVILLDMKSADLIRRRT